MKVQAKYYPLDISMKVQALSCLQQLALALE